MRIKSIEIIPIEVPLKSRFKTGFGQVSSRKILIIKVFTSDALGIAECPVLGPFYSYETIQIAWHIIKEYITPAIVGKTFNNVGEYVKAVSFIRGHRMAKAGVELALWDVLAKREGIPLYKLIGGVKRKIPCQISIGIKSSPAELLQEIGKGLDEGYRQIKIKIRPGWDINVVKLVRNRYPEIPLTVDANASYTLRDEGLLMELDKYGLTMIEQPFYYGDLYDHAVLQSKIKTPICLDESINSLADVKTAIALGSCKIINIKVSRVGGLYETIKMQDFCLKKGVPVWCGGMIETDLGKAFNLAAASLPGFTLPNDVTPSMTYFTDTIVSPAIKMDKNGYIEIPDRPGLGYEVNEKFISKYRATQ